MKYNEISEEFFASWKSHRSEWDNFFTGNYGSWEREEFNDHGQDLRAIERGMGNIWASTPRMVNFAKDHPNIHTILDNGGGHGRDAMGLAELGYDVTLFDKDYYKLGMAADRVYGRNINLQIKKGMSQSLPFADCMFDMEVYNLVMMLLPSKEDVLKALKESYRVLKNGGFIIGMTESDKTLGNDEVVERWVRRYRADGMAHLLLSVTDLYDLFVETGFVRPGIVLSEEMAFSIKNFYNIKFIAQK
jgi:ubiquinone/menaquinone biosynthesis C-methylase UbiE